MCKIFFAFLFLATFSFAPRAQAQLEDIGDALGYSPFFKWKTLESEHFLVHHDEKLAAHAQKAAEHFEEAHALLSPKLNWTPRTKTHIVVIDNTDLSNGLTSAALRFGIVLYVTPPESWFSTNYYDDWLRLVCIHEYVHYLNMDATTSWMEVLRLVFGDVIRPNSLLPSWMLEGLAVYFETRFTKAGRGRSTLYEMILRAAVEEKALGTAMQTPLDRINGPTNPYAPGGESPYLFGYELTHQLAKDPVLSHRKTTDDGDDTLRSGEDALGILSIRSSHRVPFFINDNVENVTGKDWYKYWELFLNETNKRITKELEVIQSEPTSPFEKLTDRGLEIYGSALAHEKPLIAFTMANADRRPGLYLKNLESGEVTRLGDKLYGNTVAFTNDDRFLIVSEINRTGQWFLFSDVWAYDLEKNRKIRLTQGLRAKDPALSRDGKQLVFTVSKDAKTMLAKADIFLNNNDELELKPFEPIYEPSAYSRVATPIFSADGSSIFFTLKETGQIGEAIVEFNIHKKELKKLTDDSRYHAHFPALDSDGKLYFISDSSGVDNLYEYVPGKAPNLISNFTTGFWFPSFHPTKKQPYFYGAHYSVQGWDLVRVKREDAKKLDPEKVKVTFRNDLPQSEELKKETSTYPIKPYSVFSTLAPRQWAPLLFFRPGQTYFGAQALGFDTTDRHRYLGLIAYDTYTRKVDGLAVYQNRTLGPTFSFLYSQFALDSEISRKRGSFQAFFPFRTTWSSIIPQLSFQADRTFNTSGDATSSYVPSIDFITDFSNRENVKLGISPEKGRTTRFGSRLFFEPATGSQSAKFLFADSEYFRITDHSILSPKFVATYAPAPIDYLQAYSVAAGRAPLFLSSDPDRSSANLDQIYIRGYPNQSFYGRSILKAGFDYRFPLLRIFRGLGTNPAYFENVYGFAFSETLYFPFSNTVLPASGGGVRLNSQFFGSIPVTFSLEYHQGWKDNLGGKSEILANIYLAGISL